MSEQEQKYREVLNQYARGQATQEQVRAADPMRTTIHRASDRVAQDYVDRQRSSR